MSLLLEALKKAEKAKEEAQRRARGEAPAGGAPLRLEGEAAPAAAEAAPRVMTRDELPKISQPLEIVSEDLAPAPRAAQGPAASGGPSSKPQPAREASPASDRAAAKKVFEAKFKEPNPRLPFYITVGVLGAFAVGTVVYFWYQLRPPPALVNSSPRPQGNEGPAPAQAAAPAAAPSAPAPSANAIPGLPQQASGAITPSVAAAPAAATPAAPEARPTAGAPAAPRLKPAPLAEPRREERTPEVTVTRPAPQQVAPHVSGGYAAYGAGNLAVAREEYQQALREEPANRDALLGLAAVELRSGHPEAAEAAYLRVLQIDPRDPHAAAALISLRGRADPVAAETRIKGLLASEPGAHELYFALGNQLAQQGRWGEAQQQYFKAFSAEPENADFAYNLAVSLDHIGQPKPALEYYRRALALAAKSGASFSTEAARERAAQLSR